MERNLNTLHVRLQEEEEHLAWFVQSGQRINTQGVDTTQEYIDGVKGRIASIKKQILNHSQVE